MKVLYELRLSADHSMERLVSTPLNCVKIYFWVLCYIPLIQMYVLLPALCVLIPPCLNYHNFLFSFEAGKKAGFWFCSFAILGPVYFYVNFRISLSSFCQKGRWDFDSDCMELVDQIWL